MTQGKEFSIELEVRDYECDIQGIVNNSVYQNYLEHARHKFLKSRGMNFLDITRSGINLVVIRIEIDYKYSLSSGDRFYVTVKTAMESRLKMAFLQEIRKLADDQLVVAAKVIGIALNERDRPCISPELEKLL